jgi:hypothetical protein
MQHMRLAACAGVGALFSAVLLYGSLFGAENYVCVWSAGPCGSPVTGGACEKCYGGYPGLCQQYCPTAQGYKAYGQDTWLCQSGSGNCSTKTIKCWKVEFYAQSNCVDCANPICIVYNESDSCN